VLLLRRSGRERRAGSFSSSSFSINAAAPLDHLGSNNSSYGAMHPSVVSRAPCRPSSSGLSRPSAAGRSTQPRSLLSLPSQRSFSLLQPKAATDPFSSRGNHSGLLHAPSALSSSQRRQQHGHSSSSSRRRKPFSDASTLNGLGLKLGLLACAFLLDALL
jgi:hypothetical protein